MKERKYLGKDHAHKPKKGKGSYDRLLTDVEVEEVSDEDALDFYCRIYDPLAKFSKDEAYRLRHLHYKQIIKNLEEKLRN